MATIKKEDMLKAISEMSVLELVELVDAVKEKFGITDAMLAPAAAAAAPGAGPAQEAVAEEKSAWNVMLTSFGEKKIEVIKQIRQITGLALKEAKDLVEASQTKPSQVKEGASKEDAEKIKKQLEDAGATVELS